jgi:phage gp29-like protein
MGVIDFFRGLVTRAPRQIHTSSVAPEVIEIGELPLSMQLRRIGGAMTPQQASAAMQSADMGRMWELTDLSNDARQKDCHLQSILGTREMAVAALPWQVSPRGEPRKNRVRKNKHDVISEFVTDALTNASGAVLPSGDRIVSFRTAIAHLASGPFHGRAVCEGVYGRDGRRMVPIGFGNVEHRRINFALETGRIAWWDPNGFLMPYPGIELCQFAPGKLLVHQPRINGDDQVHEGLARVLLWASLFRNWDLRDWVTFGELAWKPWRTAKYEKSADKKDIATLIERLRKMSASGVLVHPDTTEVTVEWPKNPGSNGGTHAELFAVLGAEMSKAVLGQTLTSEQGSKGSQALGKVHDSVRGDILEYDASCIAETIQRDLIGPLVRMNFGDDAEVPLFRFLTEEAVDLQAFSTGVKNLRDAGLRIGAPWVRDRIGAPEPEEDEEVLGEGEEDIPIDPKTGLPAEPPEDAKKPADDKPAEPKDEEKA